MTQDQRIAKVLAKYEPEIRDAFLAAIKDLSDQAQIGVIVDKLQQGDLEGALQAVHIDPAAYQALDTTVRQAFIEGGTTTSATLPVIKAADGAALVIRFDAGLPDAARWLASHSATMITDIVADQQKAVRAALEDGMRQGVNPQTTALNIVGRIDAATGKRTGGILGLSSVQERYVASARAELTSGNPTLMRNYLTRTRRDARFDAVVTKAIADKKPLDAATASRLVSRYSDRLLQLRGETIGRTESMASIHEAQWQSYQQAVAKGQLTPAQVRKGWKATKDKKTRDSHRHLDGTSVGLNEKFENGLLYPGDPEGDISETANCRCRVMYRIDYLSNLR